MSDPNRTILVATHNQGKVREYEALLSGLDVSWVGLGDLDIAWDVEESGTTFEENAVLKAVSYARASGYLTLADDSGLEVDALDGRPGVYTARFGGEGLSPVQRYELLLETLAGVPEEARTARFCCVVALARSGELVATARGTIEGMIAGEPSGSGGFGYDPVFYVKEYGMTMAQLSPDTKNRISHRAQALAAIQPALAALLEQRRSG